MTIQVFVIDIQNKRGDEPMKTTGNNTQTYN